MDLEAASTDATAQATGATTNTTATMETTPVLARDSTNTGNVQARKRVTFAAPLEQDGVQRGMAEERPTRTMETMSTAAATTSSETTPMARTTRPTARPESWAARAVNTSTVTSQFSTKSGVTTGAHVAGHLPTTSGGERYVIAAVEYVTRYAVAMTVKRHTAENVAAFLMKNVVLKFGAFREILTDGALELTGKVIEQLVIMLQAQK
ncbi:Gag-pol fusion protein [Phytophthora cinnamomi]|uniref:Gag-pol fusion protein n=1 Tax=Phytophthora cinnamomi TaxID=4785 RepID=UPI00355AACB3|nr:Gag-pol fusion protein [Phytophthora cinnamomi]